MKIYIENAVKYMEIGKVDIYNNVFSLYSHVYNKDNDVYMISGITVFKRKYLKPQNYCFATEAKDLFT